MIGYNELINNTIYSGIGNDIGNLFLFVIFSLVFSIAIDVLYGELPTRIHPVVIIGSIISFFKNVFIKINDSFVTHCIQFPCQSTAVCTEKIRHLHPAQRDLNILRPLLLRLLGKIGHNLFTQRFF